MARHQKCNYSCGVIATQDARLKNTEKDSIFSVLCLVGFFAIAITAVAAENWQMLITV